MKKEFTYRGEKFEIVVILNDNFHTVITRTLGCFPYANELAPDDSHLLDAIKYSERDVKAFIDRELLPPKQDERLLNLGFK